MSALLEARCLVVEHRSRHGRVRALDGVSLTLGDGATLGVLGRSGSGKSTLVRALLGLQPLQSGTVHHDGVAQPTGVRHPTRARTRAFRRQVQYVAQDPATTLDPRRGVHHLLRDPLRRLGVEGDHDARVRNALDAVGLEPDIARRLPTQISGGQAQRVAIARALAIGPRFLVADEPTSGLDPELRLQVLAVLADVTGRRGCSPAPGVGLLLVSHDLDAVALLCRDALVLDAGCVVEAAPTRELLEQPTHPATRALVEAARSTGFPRRAAP